MTTIDDLPYLDLLGEEYAKDPYGVLERMRSITPVARGPIGVVVLSYGAARDLLLDGHVRGAVGDLITAQGVNTESASRLLRTFLGAQEGEDHKRVRGAVSRAFTRRAADRRRESMRRIATGLLSTFVADGRCEFMSAFADHYAIGVLCELLGIPEDDHHRFIGWLDSMANFFSFEAGLHIDEIEHATESMFAYVEALVRIRADSDADDMLCELVAIEKEGNLSREELLTLLIALIFAGHDTSRNQLGIAMYLFAQQPDRWKQLRDRPELIESTVEEVMRFRGTTTMAFRMTTDAVKVGDLEIPKDTLLAISTGSANRDPAAFGCPNDFDIAAKRPNRHMTFAAGPHYCLGASLATVELQEAISVLASGMANLAVEGEPEFTPAHGIYGPKALQLRFDPVAALVGGAP